MKHLRCTLRFSEESLHPVHRSLGERNDLSRDVLLHGNTSPSGWDAFLFYVEGNLDTYTEALSNTDRILEYEITHVDEERFYAYVKQTTNDLDAGLFEAFSRPGVILIPPIEFRSDGTARLEVVGESDELQDSIERVPTEVSVTIDRIGDYDGFAASFDPELTERQLETLAEALDAGYYDVPRTGRVEDVADRLGCAPGTASEHLRKAERNVIRTVVEERVP